MELNQHLRHEVALRTKSDAYHRVFKRAIDLTLASVLLIIAAPLICLAAALIVLEDGFPVFFTQWRVGVGGRRFCLYKLRSMVRSAEALQVSTALPGESEALRNDPPGASLVTGVGRILRRWSIDELPQLYNVLRGDMSLVGPRPELPRIVNSYAPWQWERFATLPGITGWWQVTRRGSRPMHFDTEADLYYVRNSSLWLDLRILMFTPLAIIRGRGFFRPTSAEFSLVPRSTR